jgi:serine/threonine protein kinase/Tol biopolymer transport system component
MPRGNDQPNMSSGQMTPERWARVERLYHGARDLTPDARRAYLAEACGADRDLRDEVEALLSEPVSGDGIAGTPARAITAAFEAALSPMAGRTLGAYQLEKLIGAGGMGEVYLARDTRLGRDVAIKILPAAFTRDADRLARFEREARMLAALNHPNICAIHGIEEVDGLRFLILELVDGVTLAGRLADVRTKTDRRGLPIGEAITIARQILDALEAAHERGIVHRDLKPANICVTRDGVVKVLDFGLAKPIGSAADSASQLATAAPSREFGQIVGTAAYMSPEQARGLPIDRRTDMWAFGCVLYEMVTGRVVFAGETDSDSIAKVLEREPDWLALPADTPLAIRRVLVRTLTKNPRQRLRDAGDAKIEIEAAEEVLPGLPAPVPRATAGSRTSWLPWAVIVAAAAMSGLWLLAQREPLDPNPLARATFTPLTAFPGTEMDAAISPDGTWLVFLGDMEGPFHVWLSQLGVGTFRNLTPGSDDYQNPGFLRAVGFSGHGSEIWNTGTGSLRLALMPLMGGEPRAFLEEQAANVAWSTDRTRLAYFTIADGDPLFVADGSGGNPRRIFVTDSKRHNHFPAWSHDGRWIYFTHGRQSISEFDIWRIPSTGGTPERLTELDTNVRYVTPIDDRTVLFVAPDQNKSGPWLWALDVERKVTRRVSIGLERYVSVSASADGRRLLASVAAPVAGLWRLPILDRPAGDADVQPHPVPAARALAPRFAAESTLYFLSSSGGGDGLWRLREGKTEEIWKGASGAVLEAPSISPTGEWIAVMLRKPSGQQLSLVSADGAVHHALGESVASRGTAAWSPDGTRIAVGGVRGSTPGLFAISVAGGSVTQLLTGDAYDPAWSPKGDLIVYTADESEGVSLRAIRPDGTRVGLPAIDAMPLAVNRARHRMASTRFLPDGSGFVFLYGPPGVQTFWLMDFATNTVRMVARLSNASEITTFDISPDGSHIVFDRVQTRSNLVLIER